MTESVPVLLLTAPFAEDEVPAKQFPVMFIWPVELLNTDAEPFKDPPVQSPVIFTIPVEEFLTAFTKELPKVPLPPMQFPVIDKVPVPKLLTAVPFNVLPVHTPTIVAEAGTFDKNSKQLPAAPALLVTFAVSVMPSLMTNFPVPALEISSQVVLTSIVIVWPVEARASSPTPGTTPPVHVAPAEKLPLAAEVMSAMAYSPFVCR